MTIPSGENRLDGNMAPPMFSNVYFAAAKSYFGGWPFLRAEIASMEAWHLLCSLMPILLPQNPTSEDDHSFGRKSPRWKHGTSYVL
jgi:hypothetical protein